MTDSYALLQIRKLALGFLSHSDSFSFRKVASRKLDQSDLSAISRSVDIWGSHIRISDSGEPRSMADITLQQSEKPGMKNGLENHLG